MNSPDPALLAKGVRELLGGRAPVDDFERKRMEALVLMKVAIRQALSRPLFGLEGRRYDAVELEQSETLEKGEPSALETIRNRSGSALAAIRTRLGKEED